MATYPDIDAATYISFATYKKDGERVATPVWVARVGDRYAFTTNSASWKAKRLRRDPRVQVSACNARGVVKDGAACHSGRGSFATGATADQALRALSDKYGLQWKALAASAAVGRLFGRETSNDSVVVIDLD